MLKSLHLRVRSSFQQLKAALFATWSWIIYCLLAPVVGVLVFALPVEKPRWSVMRLAVKFLAAMTRTKVRVHGAENLPEKKEACILVSNHASYLDGYVITALLGGSVSFVAKAELKESAIVAVLLKRIGTLFVERFDLQKGIKDAKTIADKGMTNRSLFFFPEGTFMRMPGLLPFKMGAFETAARTGLPIIPIAIRGTRSILRADSWFPRHGTISVTFGKPIIIENPHSEKQETWQDALHLRDKSREWILMHCGEPDLGHERPRLQPSGPTLSD